MIYVMSDIHGKYDKYIQMLKQIHFSEKDTMYILGDMIDRGEKGMELFPSLAVCTIILWQSLVLLYDDTPDFIGFFYVQKYFYFFCFI